MAAQKFTNFGKFLKKAHCYNSCHNTKLFRMTLKTTKHYQSHCTEKPSELCGQSSR